MGGRRLPRLLEHGLETPPAAAAATADYREEMDVVGASSPSAASSNLTRARKPQTCTCAVPKYWTRANGHDPITQRTFGTRLAERGFTKQRLNTGYHWNGIAVSSPSVNGEAS